MENCKIDNGFVWDGSKIHVVPMDRIFVMPAPIGSVVYDCEISEVNQITTLEVTGYDYTNGEWWVTCSYDGNQSGAILMMCDLGKTWFLTPEEAIASLRAATGAEGGLDQSYLEGMKEGKSQFAAELKEYIYRNYGEEKGAVRATASHITDMIDALSYGYSGWGAIPKTDDFVRGVRP